MSLIPSESYSFPDHFSSTRAASRNPKREPEPEEVEPPRKKPAIVALPDPKPKAKTQTRPQPAPVMVQRNPEPVRKIAPPVPNPALRRASAPPARIPEAPVRKLALPPGLKPKVRWNNRAPAIDPSAMANNGNGNGAHHLQDEPLLPPAQNVIQMKPAPAPRPPRVIPRPENKSVPPSPRPTAVVPPRRTSPIAPPPKPAAPAKAVQPAQRAPMPPPEKPRPVSQAAAVAPVRPRPRVTAAPAPQADFFEMFAESHETAVSKRRRKAKMRRFMICESIAVGILLPLAILGLAHRPENLALIWIMNILTITSAVAAALIPILFFALTPTLPEIES